jgi:trans-2,3-dihydro-3-hydroxyanthranilate isomerase
MDCALVTLDVFTDEVFGGNPLAVLPDASGLSDEAMQAIAREFNLSETTFVLAAAEARNTHRVRIFTPVAELPFAGHPTLGAAVALALADPSSRDNYEYKFEEGVGVVPVSVSRTATGVLKAELSVAKLPEQLPEALTPTVWGEILGLDDSTVCPDETALGMWSCGTPFSFIPVANLTTLHTAQVDLAAWQRHLGNSETTGVFVFTRATGNPNIDIRARMFAPAHGISEDPATGSAVAALAGWLVESEKPGEGTHVWTISQGVEMGRPSLLILEADVEKGRIASVRVSGCAIPVTAGTITVP